jgi:cytoskeletal protein CcmA (bactofilin family)
MPTRYEVICYDCGYAFQQTGKSRSTVCPKCHHQLDFIDYTIDKEWSESLKTAGTIRITRQGIIKAGELVGAHIILKGEVKGGTVRALQRLELCPACTFAEEHVTGQDLCIGQGVELTLKRKHTFRHVEIHGTLKAVFKSTGLVSIAATGLMQGEIDGTRLAVETGGGLKGAFRFVPA